MEIDYDELIECQDIARGYMAPENNAINQFAQVGKVDNGLPEISDGLVAELDREQILAMREHADICASERLTDAVQIGVGSDSPRVAELSGMLIELSRVRAFVISQMGAVEK